MKKKSTPVTKEIAIQSFLRPALTRVSPNKDYEKFRQTIKAFHQLVIKCHLEDLAIECGRKKLLEEHPEADVKAHAKQAEYSIKALRVNLLKANLGNPSLRSLSTNIATSELLLDFCRVRRIDGISGVSKSELGRMVRFFSEEEIRLFHLIVTETAGNAEYCAQAGLEKPVDTSICLIDSTCLETNIHYPVDWVLFRDVSGANEAEYGVRAKASIKIGGK